jgi:four helix bundle protein
MARTNFENLRIYLMAEMLSDEVCHIARKWPSLARDTVGKQLIRAADSVGVNIAEGSGRGTDPEFIRFLRIARGSLYEAQHWLRRAYRRDLLTKRQITTLRSHLAPLALALNAYLASVARRTPKT